LRLQVRIYYEDTDSGGIVYHTNYIKYCERARSEEFFKRGMMPFGEDKSGFVVKSIRADFIGTAKLGDMLEVTTAKIAQKGASLTLLQEIFKEGQKVFGMEVLLAYIVEGRPKRIPEELRDIL